MMPHSSLPTSRFVVAVIIFFWWLLLIVGGFTVNTMEARRFLGQIGKFATLDQATNKTVSEIPMSRLSVKIMLDGAQQNTNQDFFLIPATTEKRELQLKVLLDGNEISSSTASFVAGSATASTAMPAITFGNVLKAVVISTLFWTWSNLMFLGAAASAFSSVLRQRSAEVTSLKQEIGWSLINGFLIVCLFGCGQVFIGEGLYRSLGISEALQNQIRQDRYLLLAFFTSFMGLFLGLARARVDALGDIVPFFGKRLFAAESVARAGNGDGRGSTETKSQDQR